MSWRAVCARPPTRYESRLDWQTQPPAPNCGQSAMTARCAMSSHYRMKSYAESTTLNLQLALSQQGVLIPRSTDNLEAYDDVLRGAEYLLSFTRDGNLKAREMFEKA